MFFILSVFFFQAEDGIRDLVRSRGLGDVYKRQIYTTIKMENYNDGVYIIQLTNDHSIISQKIQLLK